MKSEDSLLGSFGKIFALILMVAIMAPYSGFVLNKLWGWFIDPVFDFSAPGTALATGLLVVMGFLQNKLRSNKERKEKTFSETATLFFEVLAFNSLLLLFGYIISIFV